MRRTSGRIPSFEAIGRSVDHALHGAPDPCPPVAAIVEPLEHRILLSTFNAFISGTPGGPHTSNFQINLWTTGGQATQWVVHWGDNTSNTYNASSYPGGVFPVPFSPPAHTYTHGPYSITATATPTSGPSASVTYALNSGFGSLSSQGETTATPSGATGNAGGYGIAVDTSGGTNNGSIYALSAYGSYAAVTRFTAAGAVDTTFGNATTPGTFKLTGMGTGTPTAITISSDGKYVAVAGQFSGWGAAVIDTTANQGQGSIKWTESDIVSTGQPNALAFEPSDTGTFLFVAGSVTGVSPHASCGALIELDATTGGTACGWNNGNGAVTFAPSGFTCEYGTAVIDLDGGYGDGAAVAGYCTYAGGSDFTLIEINDDGTVGHSIVRTNIGNTMGSGNGAVNTPSTDTATCMELNHDYTDIIVAGYTNATSSTVHMALAAYDPSTLALDTRFGLYSDGLSVGPAGKAYSITPLSSTSSTMEVGGSVNNDFVVCQFTNSGSLDTNNFGTGGIFTVDFGDTSSNSTDGAYGIGIETDANGTALSIVLGGSTTPSGGNAKIALADLLLSPSITIT